MRVHARSSTRYPWGYLHEAMEVDGVNALELLFNPCIDQDVHALFLHPIGQSDPQALHMIIQGQRLACGLQRAAQLALEIAIFTAGTGAPDLVRARGNPAQANAYDAKKRDCI